VNLATVDQIVLLIYLLLVVAFGLWMGKKQQDAADFMLGGRTLPTWAILLSIVATETSTVTFLSIPGWAYQNGVAWQQIPLGYVLGRLLVIVVLMPRYFSGEMYTAYEVLHRRFGGSVQKLASVLFIVTRTLADGLRLFLTALVLQIVVGIPFVESVVAIGIATVLYTFLGGMRAVVWTDAVQFLLYVAGALLALFVILGQVDGGWDTVLRVGTETGRLTWFDTGWDVSKVDTLWAGLIGGAVLSFSTHGVDQMMVQRYLSARSRGAASTALALSGIVVWGQFVLFLLLGVALFVYYGQQVPAPSFEKGDRILSTFIVDHMPKGTVGLLLGAVFAAAMSTLSSSLNSSATTLVRDLIRGARARHPIRADARARVHGAVRWRTGPGRDLRTGCRREHGQQRPGDCRLYDRADPGRIPARAVRPAGQWRCRLYRPGARARRDVPRAFPAGAVLALRLPARLALLRADRVQ
jgi:SSS family solute:Na+ symporter